MKKHLITSLNFKISINSLKKCKLHIYCNSLIFFKYCANGRNNQGKITVRHKGGSHKKLYRLIDFKRNKKNILGYVQDIQYDPNRNVKIALICYQDGEKRYILCPQNLYLYDFIINGSESSFYLGNTLRLKNIPIGYYVHNIELKKNTGGKLVRSAGTSAKILIKKENHVIIRLPSNEIRLINKNCYATIGIIDLKKLNNNNKAGRNRWLGIRPTIRGVAMNACDHPHGGGEGRSPIGRKTPLTPWGKIALGKKTRKKVHFTNTLIIKRRH